MSEQVIRPEGIPSEEAFGSFTVSMRGYFSTQHLWSAEHFTRLAAELEAAHTGAVLDPTAWTASTSSLNCSPPAPGYHRPPHPADGPNQPAHEVQLVAE
jgi:hypothetical protein